MRNLALILERGSSESFAKGCSHRVNSSTISEAISWLRKAAEGGLVDAMFNLGNCLYTHTRRDGSVFYNEKGDHGGGDVGTSMVWWAMAGQAGHAKACLNMGDHCREGFTAASHTAGQPKRQQPQVEDRQKEAYGWYLRASQHGTETPHGNATIASSAQFYLGMYRFHGGCPGVPVDRKAGIAWWEKAAGAGCTRSQRALHMPDPHSGGAPVSSMFKRQAILAALALGCLVCVLAYSW
jgi:TPR repeat protein